MPATLAAPSIADLEAKAKVIRRDIITSSHTVKGYPIADMLSDHNYHGKVLSPEEAKKALARIG